MRFWLTLSAMALAPLGVAGTLMAQSASSLDAQQQALRDAKARALAAERRSETLRQEATSAESAADRIVAQRAVLSAEIAAAEAQIEAANARIAIICPSPTGAARPAGAGKRARAAPQCRAPANDQPADCADDRAAGAARRLHPPSRGDGDRPTRNHPPYRGVAAADRGAERTARAGTGRAEIIWAMPANAPAKPPHGAGPARGRCSGQGGRSVRRRRD